MEYRKQYIQENYISCFHTKVMLKRFTWRIGQANFSLKKVSFQISTHVKTGNSLECVGSGLDFPNPQSFKEELVLGMLNLSETYDISVPLLLAENRGTVLPLFWWFAVEIWGIWSLVLSECKQNKNSKYRLLITNRLPTVLNGHIRGFSEPK